MLTYLLAKGRNSMRVETSPTLSSPLRILSKSDLEFRDIVSSQQWWWGGLGEVS